MAYSTKQQQAVLHCLETRGEAPLTAAALAEELRQNGSPVGLATVYRQLERLAQSGMVHKINTEEGAFYQYCPHQAEAHHSCFLLRCEDCGRIVHLDWLEAEGHVHKITTEDGALYQYCPHAGEHHCFLLRCEDCGRIVHLDCVHLQHLYDHLETEHHFRIDPRRTILTGLCQTCSGKEALHGSI